MSRLDRLLELLRFVAVAICCCEPAMAAMLPADSGAINVRTFGARGDGKTDDTRAIRAAIQAAQVEQGKTFWPSRVVFFPAGTYRLTGTLDNKDATGLFRNAMVLVGESTQAVTLRLDDAAPGYDRADRPKAVVFTSAKLFDGTATSGGKDYLGKGEGNDAYGNYVEDMTIDVGRANPGAVAIDFLASNVGAVRRVALVAGAGSGRIGISLDRKWPGPLLLMDVRIEGFAIGISISQPEYSVTMEGLQLRGQSEVAIRNDGNSVSMRDVSIATGAVALQNLGAEGLIVADRLSVTLARGAADWIGNRGYLTLKNTTVSWPDAVRRAGLSGGDSGAYRGGERLAGYDAGWRIAPQAAPAAFAPPLARWASVAQHGAQPDSGVDASAALRAAFASGAAVVYFPSGRYEISEPIDVPASVRRIVGMHASVTIRPTRANGFAREIGMLRVRTGGEPLTIEALALDNAERGDQLGVEHAGARVLVLRDLITAGTSIERTSTGGRLFLENLCCGNLIVTGTEGVWARQLNSEGGATRIVNAGSPLSILGLKVEQNCTVIENLRGAETEVLGGLIYQVQAAKLQKPAFINHDGARLSVSYTEEAYIAGSNYLEHVVQTGSMRPQSVVTAAQLPARGKLARLMPGLSFFRPEAITERRGTP